MSKYDELRMAVSSLVTAEDIYWEKLYDTYFNFQANFREFLGLTNEKAVDSKGTIVPILTTGLYDPASKQIMPTAPSALPKEDRKLCFQFLLNLCSSETEDIQIRKLINVKVRRRGDEYYFEFEGFPSEIKCYEIDGNVDMTPLFDAVHSALITKLNVRN
jgi:hypothetical protein